MKFFHSLLAISTSPSHRVASFPYKALKVIMCSVKNHSPPSEYTQWLLSDPFKDARFSLNVIQAGMGKCEKL